MCDDSQLDDDGADFSTWAQSGAVLVAPGVVRIPLPMDAAGLQAVNVYAIDAGDGVLLVDGGLACDEAEPALADGLARIGATPSDIQMVVVTHHHLDHYSNALVLRRDYGVEVAIGRHEQESVTVGQRDDRLEGTAARLRRAGAPDLIEPYREHLLEVGHYDLPVEDPDRWIESGETLKVGGRSLEALRTPGHTRGHVVLHDVAAGLMFTGDHLLPRITPTVGFESAPRPGSLAEYLASHEYVLSRPDARMLPAHGSTDGRTHQRSRELRDHHRDRLVEIAAMADEAVSAFDAASGLRWTRHDRSLLELPVAHRVLAIIETAVHLEYLAATGTVKVWDHEGVELFARS